jgi:hypothetical protein
MTITKNLLHQYRANRAHQMDTYGPDGLYNGDKHIGGHSGGGAVVGFHAAAAYWSAQSHLHFMTTLKADLATIRKRSLAAKRGWKTRKR